MLIVHLVVDAGDVEQVAAVLGDQRIDQRDTRAERDQAAGQVAADEAQPAGDQHRRPCEGVAQLLAGNRHR